MRGTRSRRRGQAGTTLVELLVSLIIASLALALIIGTLSTGLLDATLVKRNTAIQAVMRYEMEQVQATNLAASYSDCFATESPSSPVAAGGYLGSCPAGPYTLRADVNLVSTSGTSQLWQINVRAWPTGSDTVAPVQVYAAH